MATLSELWKESTAGTPWALLNVERELANAERLAVRPRIPADHLIFRVFRAFPLPQTQVKVVLLGQDPYPEVLELPVLDSERDDDTMTISRACGFSFSSPHGYLPKSLQTIYSEILREYPQLPVEVPGKRVPRKVVTTDFSGDLSYLIADGVMLLNTYLTIRYEFDEKRSKWTGVPASHTSWEALTTQVLNFIRRSNPKVVYLALGKNAADMYKASGINDAIECDHPASRGGGRNPFKGSDIFQKANALLAKRGVKEIDWIPMKRSVDVNYHDEALCEPKIHREEAKKVVPVHPVVLAPEEFVEPPMAPESDEEDEEPLE